MKLQKLAFLFSALLASVLMNACTSNDEVATDNGFTCLGLVSYEPASFAPASPSSAVVRTKDIFGSTLPSGDKTSLLWGAIVIQDY